MDSLRPISTHRRFLSSFSVTALVGLAACVSNDPSTDAEAGADGGGAAVDGSPSDLDATGGGDASSGDASACTLACVESGAALSCGTTRTACAFGCAEPTSAAAAHCRVFDPSGAVDGTDLSQPGLGDFTGKNLKFFTDTGRITTSDEGTELRAANAVPATEEVSSNGIGFRLVAGKLGIFQFKNFTLQPSGGFTESNSAFGTVALAIVAAEEVAINGILDVGSSGRIYNSYPSAGSFAGAATPANAMTQVDGNGPGRGHAGEKSVASGGKVISGGGGAGHGAAGGAGGDGVYTGGTEAVVFGGSGGVAYDDGSFDPPLGGSGGGAGSSGGGRGGGAVQIVAGKRITIGDGTGPDAGAYGMAQGINAGGCAGGSSLGAAGGGGAGGTIVLESLAVVGKANAGVASNGGGGGGAGDGAQSGTISATPTPGTLAIDCTAGSIQAFGAGGSGGAGSTPLGTKGTPPSNCGFVMKWGGGGGGAAGRVRINTSTGAFTGDAKFVVSPSGAPALQQGVIVTR